MAKKYIDIELTREKIYNKWGTNPARCEAYYTDGTPANDAGEDAKILEMLDSDKVVTVDSMLLWHKGVPKKDGDYMCAMDYEGGYNCVMFTVSDGKFVGLAAGFQKYFERKIHAYIEIPAPPVKEKRTRRKSTHKEKNDAEIHKC